MGASRRSIRLFFHHAGGTHSRIAHEGRHRPGHRAHRSAAHARHTRRARHGGLFLVLPGKRLEVRLDFSGSAGHSDVGIGLRDRRALKPRGLSNAFGGEADQKRRLQQPIIAG